MNYLKIYINLIRKTKTRLLDKKIYSEKHHIFPQSIFGNNKSIVKLTAKEHFIAHFLLWKICKQRYGIEHYRTKKMHFAFNQMTWAGPNHKRYTTRSFEYAREASQLYNIGNNNPAKRPENRIKISKGKTGKTRPDMIGKSYMGAPLEIKINAVAKMTAKKKGQKINYPQNRNSPPCKETTKTKISEARLKSKYRYINMSDEEFLDWLSNQSLIGPKGRKNSNITRAIKWRKEYGKINKAID